MKVKVGDTVFRVTFQGRPLAQYKVTEVKKLKRGRKVTLDDGTVWDWDYNGRSWGNRTARYYVGNYVKPATEENVRRFRREVLARRMRDMATRLTSDLYTSTYTEAEVDELYEVVKALSEKELS